MIKIRSGVYHTVGKGETLWRIAYTYGVDIQDIAEINNIKEPTLIKIGQKIFIPGVSKLRKVVPYEEPTVVVSGKKKPRKKRAPPPPRYKKKVVVSKGHFSWPVKGSVISKFGMREGGMHYGIDIKAPKGSSVRASGDGVVVYSDNKMRGYGNVVILKHDDDFFTVYAHNDSNLVSVGDKVKKGNVIAKVGNSGRASTYHLHFEVRQGRKTRNPLFFLP